jgi:ribonuclease BN (tRNA processing enzyme)
MENDSFIKFLGTAGARFVVARQLRASGGTFLHIKGQRIMLDPGPGTLVRCAKSRPKIDATALDAIILTHSHIDHSNDVNILIDAMTAGGFEKRGRLFAPAEALHGENAVILNYLRDFLQEINVLEPQCAYQTGDVSFSTSIRHRHSAETYGVKVDVGGLTVSFLADTQFFPELIESYTGSDILVINLVRYEPHESGKILHLCVEDAREILSHIRPQRAILTHFGMTMLKAKPWLVAEQLSNELGISVTAASDGMTVDLGQ